MNVIEFMRINAAGISFNTWFLYRKYTGNIIFYLCISIIISISKKAAEDKMAFDRRLNAL